MKLYFLYKLKTFCPSKQVIINSSSNLESEEYQSLARAEDSNSDETENTNVTQITTSVHETERIHQNFRLWVTTCTNTNQLVPGMLIQYGFKVVCKVTHNIKNSLKRMYLYAERVFGHRQQSIYAMQKVEL